MNPLKRARATHRGRVAVSVAVMVLLALAGGALAWALLAGTEALLDGALPHTGKAFSPTATAPQGESGPVPEATEGCGSSSPAPGPEGCHEPLPGESTGAEPAGPWWVMLLLPAGLGLLVCAVSGRRR
ncbi:hypothetical protein JK364_49460 [Streptomyces sp. 110]|uniref:Secreted protein n=1 Tax=Streptomyces endocoffeicus TaxID=2898945 RepID=A0ABS1Q6H8_9ACTN|nr:hypothetical protein [Streptomyces endocoffeicus]MBL1120268.1 hypothetical protein [Streptomyces endocoffeicus]